MKNNYTIKNLLKSLLIYIFILTTNISFSQTLNFTIDTAVDNGNSISETILDSGLPYVLTATTINNATLEDLGAGDMVFYVGSIDALKNPWVISITRDGNPAYFTLNGIDYDTVESGDISIKNQSDEIIANQATYTFGAGAITITNTVNATNILSFKIFPHDNDDLNDFAFHNISVTMGNTLGIDDFTLNNNISVYPNPSNGNITLKNNSDIQLKVLNISDVSGRILKSIKFNDSFSEKNIDLNNLNTGIYFLTIQSDNGKTTQKLIIN